MLTRGSPSTASSEPSEPGSVSCCSGSIKSWKGSPSKNLNIGSAEFIRDNVVYFIVTGRSGKHFQQTPTLRMNPAPVPHLPDKQCCLPGHGSGLEIPQPKGLVLRIIGNDLGCFGFISRTAFGRYKRLQQYRQCRYIGAVDSAHVKVGIVCQRQCLFDPIRCEICPSLLRLMNIEGKLIHLLGSSLDNISNIPAAGRPFQETPAAGHAPWSEHRPTRPD